MAHPNPCLVSFNAPPLWRDEVGLDSRMGLYRCIVCTPYPIREPLHTPYFALTYMSMLVFAVCANMVEDVASVGYIVVPLPGGSIKLETYFSDHYEKNGVPNLRNRMSLTKPEFKQSMSRDPKLNAQHTSFEEFCTSPTNLSRGVKTKAVSQGTFGGYEKAVREFLGYLLKYENVDSPDFRAFLDGPKLLRYISYRKGEAGNKASTLANIIFRFKAVLRWWISEMGRHVDSERAATDLLQGLDVLVQQVKAAAPSREHVDPEQLEAEGKWVEWPKLRAAAETYTYKTLTDVRDLRSKRSGDMSPRMANAVAIGLAVRVNKALFGLLFLGGINMGAPRPFLMKSLVIKGAEDCDPPADGTSYCSVCTHPNCRGNVIEKDGKGGYVLIITHHKMERKIREAIPPISIGNVDDKLACALLKEEFNWAHTTLSESYGSSDEPSSNDHLRVFRKSARGDVFQVDDTEDSAASMYVTKHVAEVMGVPRCMLHITCNILRRMFVEHIRAPNGENALTPEEEQGAAIAMGTSVDMFNRVYNPTRRRSLVASSQAKVRQRHLGQVTPRE